MGKALAIAALASLLLTLASLMTLQSGVAQAQSAVTATPDYKAVTRLRLPWDSQQVEELKRTNNWREHWPPDGWGAVGLGWDLAPLVTPTPTPGITILLPTSGYLYKGYHPAPTAPSVSTGYGHYVDVVTSDAGRAGWAVRLAHMSAEELVADEYACSAGRAPSPTCTPVWVPRGVPVGVMSNSGANYNAANPMRVHLHMELGIAHEGTFAAPAGFSSDGGLDQLMFEGVGPFGMNDTQLNSDGMPAVPANQTTYRPRLRLMWPLSGAVLRMSEDRDYELVIETEEWSSVHEYRWELTRAGGAELVTQGGWQRGQGTSEGAAYVADLSAGAATLGRGKYEWRAWVRFPDIRAGHAGEYYEGQPIDGSFEILDTSRVLDWLRWQAARIKGDAIAASMAEMHENPPPPLPTPEYLLEEEQPVVTHGPTAEPSTRPSAEALITRVSVASGGIEAHNGSYQPSISADGRYVAFESGASNLVDGDTNGAQDVFVHDRHTGRTTRVSVSSHGAEADDDSYQPAISADGRYVAFESLARNLVDGDANGLEDVFVHDLRTATTTRVSVGSDGTEANGDESRRSEAGPAWPTMYSSEWPSISDDGRHVAFRSSAIDLVPGDTNDHSDVFVHDRLTGRTSRVSVSSEGAQADGESTLPSISGNGRFAVFTSWAANLVPDDTNDAGDIFLHDIERATTVRVYVASPRGPGKRESPLAVISGDGRYIAFTSWADHLVPGDTNHSYDVFVFDRETSTTERVSVAVDGSEGMGNSIAPSISSDGLHVGFISSAFNLVHGDTNNQHDSFVRDRLNGTTTCVSTSREGPAGVPSGWSTMSSLSADGRYVAFVSAADNLVGGDTNGAWDVFVYDRLPGESPEWGDSVEDTPVKLSPETLDQILIAYTCTPQVSRNAICLAVGDGSTATTPVAEDWPSLRPVWSPDGEKLVYQANPDGDITNTELYVLDLASGVSTRLTHDPAHDLYPAWSPDGSRIAFISDRGLKQNEWEGGWDIYVAAPDASEERQLTDSPSPDLEPYWFSDGTRIAFASWRDGDREVYVMNSDGSDQRNLSRNSGENDFICGWLPGQSTVLYLNDHGYWAVDASGDAEPQPWTLLGKGDSCPIWSPDGRWFATTRSGPDETESILVMDGDGRIVRDLTELNRFGLSSPWQVPTMSWSPSGSHIAVTVCLYLQPCDVYVLSTSGEVKAQKIGQGGDPAVAPFPVAQLPPTALPTSTFSPQSAQEEALEALYMSTNGPGWTNNSGWLTDMPPCDWHGVECTDGRVTGLDLDSNQLSGSIPPQLGNLTSLERLLLSFNQLSGSIPPELGTLSSLELLDLSANQLSGSIPPELGSLTNVEWLDLTWNQLSGGIPPELGDLSNLELLYLGDNHLSFTMPPQLGNLASLRTLSLYGNQLSGSIPPELGNLTILEDLDLHQNQLSGSIPSQLGNLTNLKSLNLYFNQLSRSIPPELGSLINLEDLDLRANHLSGSIPSELGDLTSLESLDLASNWLSGSIPPELGNLTSLERLDLSQNQLSGSIPPELSDLTNLVVLDLARNQLSGNIPPELGNLGNLERLDLMWNQMSGTIPSELGNLTSLEGLYLASNQLSGSIPLTFVELPLKSFDYEDTNLCEPQEAHFLDWLEGISNLFGTGVACPRGVSLSPDSPQVVVNDGPLRVRAGPGTEYGVLSRMQQGESATALGRNGACDWFRVRMPVGVEGWVSAEYLTYGFDACSLPVAEATPPPSQPPAGAVSGLFADLWETYRDRLGSPLASWSSDRSYPPGTFSEMLFEHGRMFYHVGPPAKVYVVNGSAYGPWTGSGTYQAYDDTWKDGDAEFSCPAEAAYPQMPHLGFGKVWCEHPEVRAALGWGVSPERGMERENPGSSVYRLQLFEGGFMFRDIDGWANDLAYVFFNDGTFVREAY